MEIKREEREKKRKKNNYKLEYLIFIVKWEDKNKGFKCSFSVFKVMLLWDFCLKILKKIDGKKEIWVCFWVLGFGGDNGILKYVNLIDKELK